MLMPCPLVCLSAQRRHTHPLQTQTHTHMHSIHTKHIHTYTPTLPGSLPITKQRRLSAPLGLHGVSCICNWLSLVATLRIYISTYQQLPWLQLQLSSRNRSELCIVPSVQLLACPSAAAAAVAAVCCCCCCCRVLQTYERTPPTYFVSKAICLFIVEVFIVVVPLLACSSGHSWGHFNCSQAGRRATAMALAMSLPAMSWPTGATGCNYPRQLHMYL